MLVWDLEARAEPFMKARKARVLSGAEMAWSARNFLMVLLVERDCCIEPSDLDVGGEGGVV